MTEATTQPSGNSDPRYACGVVAEPTIDMAAMQAATPMATPLAMVTPMTMATPMTIATPEGMATPRSMATAEDTAASPTP